MVGCRYLLYESAMYAYQTIIFTRLSKNWYRIKQKRIGANHTGKKLLLIMWSFNRSTLLFLFLLLLVYPCSPDFIIHGLFSSCASLSLPFPGLFRFSSHISYLDVGLYHFLNKIDDVTWLLYCSSIVAVVVVAFAASPPLFSRCGCCSCCCCYWAHRSNL